MYLSLFVDEREEAGRISCSNPRAVAGNVPVTTAVAGMQSCFIFYLVNFSTIYFDHLS